MFKTLYTKYLRQKVFRTLKKNFSDLLLHESGRLEIRTFIIVNIIIFFIIFIVVIRRTRPVDNEAHKI